MNTDAHKLNMNYHELHMDWQTIIYEKFVDNLREFMFEILNTNGHELHMNLS